MKRFLALLLALTFLLSAGCRPAATPDKSLPTAEVSPSAVPGDPPADSPAPAISETPLPSPTDAPAAAADYDSATVMVYLVGSNLESQYAMGSRDLVEMFGSDCDTSRLNVLICTGGAASWWIEDIPSDSCNVYQLTDQGFAHKKKLDGVNMSNPATLTEFLDYGYGICPADCYGLVLWDHGGGAVLGFGADENYDYAAISLPQLHDSIAASRLSSRTRLEWIGFDACLMGMVEVADGLRDLCGYLIASEETEAAFGWDYSFLGPYSRSTLDGVAAGACAVESFEAYYAAIDPTKSDAPEYTLSCLDLGQTERVVSALEALIDRAGTELLPAGYSSIAQARGQIKSFGAVSNTSFYDTVDLAALAGQLSELYPEECAALTAALNDFILCACSNVADANGVAIYFPYENKEYAGAWLEAYKALHFSDSYEGFLARFVQILDQPPLADWDLSETAPTAMDGQYAIELGAAQTANLDSALYTIWQEDSEDSYICWILSRDVSLSENGTLSANFDSRQFYIGDTSGNRLLCCAIETERNAEYAKYVIPILVWEGLSASVAYVHVRLPLGTGTPEVMGVFAGIDESGSLLASRHALELADGDILSPFYFARSIRRNADGSVAPFESWDSTSGIGADFALQGRLTVTTGAVEPGQRMSCLFRLKDTQGNTYFTNPVEVQF